MTIITVTTPEGRLSLAQRQRLAQTLTDAVLEPEVGQLAPAARVGFQVVFAERPRDAMAIGGKLLSDHAVAPDTIIVNVVVMDAVWPRDLRAQVIRSILARLAEACGVAQPAPSWWVTFQVVEEGSWGSRGGVTSILSLLDTGVFTPERADAVRRMIPAAP
jgi:phenylpyruvate tautomerase PptA (4-oxalocrotonate tautomerase family)